MATMLVKEIIILTTKEFNDQVHIKVDLPGFPDGQWAVVNLPRGTGKPYVETHFKDVPTRVLGD